MEYGSLLLLFDDENPCWTEELVRTAEEDPGPLALMLGEGLLAKEGELFFLTGAGRKAFSEEAAANYLPAVPGIPGADKEKDLFRTRLRLLLDKKHIQRWGVKEFVLSARFPTPPLQDDELFTRSSGFEWIWPSSPIIGQMREDWPVTGLAARKETPPPPDAAAKWFEAKGSYPAYFEADLLHLSRYDFQAYAHIPRSPNDPWGILNADRFFCLQAQAPQAGNLDGFLATIGRFQLALEVLRRMVLPGYIDLDSFDQDGINWLLFLFEREEEAEACVSLLAPFGLDLIRGSMPMDVWALSFEALENFKSKAETIHDLIPVIGRPVVRTP